MDGIIQSTTSNKEKLCVACFQPIDSRATTCHQCSSSQVSNRWKHFGSVLKWTGGITAVISLIITLGQVNNYLIDWKNSRRNIEILLESANVQRDAEDFVNAWKSYEKVQQLDPGNTSVLGEQVTLATSWLQSVKSSPQRNYLTTDTRITGYFDNISPILYKGLVAVKTDAQLSTIYAHIGLLNLYNYQFDRQATGAGRLKNIAFETINKALDFDKSNLYANAYKAYALYYLTVRDETWEDALQYLQLVEKNLGRNQRIDIIYKLLLSKWAPDDYALNKVLEFSRTKNFVSKELFAAVYKSRFKQRLGGSRLKNSLTALPKTETLELLTVFENNFADKKDRFFVLLLRALLDEINGELTAAREKLVRLKNLDLRDIFNGGKINIEVSRALERVNLVN